MTGDRSRLEESLRIKYFEEPPSSELFSSQIEPSNVPAVFRGVVKEWIAFSKWDPHKGGLNYLQERVGPTIVEAMLSTCAPVFYGDLRSHERVPLAFSTFITSCKSCQNTGFKEGSSDDAVKPFDTAMVPPDEACSTSTFAARSHQIYLAQVPITNLENKWRTSLEILREDIVTPAFLELKQLTSINFWMNNSHSRSSTHYDPHHNLLCVVSGCKQVSLWPPSASPLLHPMPVYGEASNHSAINIEEPDLSLHPRAKHTAVLSQKTILQAGDALFIPEGWFHQVDSDELTIAVNFWWQSNMIANMSEHMDAYYLRHILNRLVGKEMDQLLFRNPKNKLKAEENLPYTFGNSEGDGSPLHGSATESKLDSKEDDSIDNLEPLVLQALHELVSLVHHNVSVDRDHIVTPSSIKSEQDHMTIMNDHLFKDDPVSSILWVLKPLVLKRILLAMVKNFPRTLEALVLHMLSPTAAEILTRKFDEMDNKTTKEQQNEFYQQFYSVFDDQNAAMDALLNGKETFAFQAFRNVLDQYLGVSVDQPMFLGRS